VLLPGSSSASSAFPRDKLGRLPASAREHDFPRICFRGCSYFFMFRPPRLLAPQIVPTAAHTPAGRPRLLRPSKTCVVTFARIGYAIRLTTGNWRNEDFHLARFSALSAAPYLRNSFLRCLALNPDGPTECTCLFLPRCHRPSLDPSQVGFPFRPRTRFFRGKVSRLSSDISYVQASEFACLPDRSHRCKFRRAAETFTSRRNVLRCLCTHRICYPPATGN